MQEELSFKELQEMVSICLDELVKIKKENGELKQSLSELSTLLKDLYAEELKLSGKVVVIDSDKEKMKAALRNLKYELGDLTHQGSEWYFPKFFELEDTMERIIRGKKSMARFGDGEFSIMVGEERPKFQKPDKKLAERLIQVIQSKEERFLVAIADNYGSLQSYNEEAKCGIRSYMTDEVRRQHRKFLNLERKYHNAYVSRPYVIYADNDTAAPAKRFQLLKRIWDGRKVLFVEGALTRMGVGNDLFDNAAQIRRIEAPSVNAFDKYDEILEAALQHAQEDTLILIALGPAAGVLAYDLYCAGLQAIDIGHVDLEYEWYLRKAGGRCEVKYKYNNEYEGGDSVEDIYDEEYESQIIADLSKG
ncbi:MAG: GT-D fold domain-containing glycosyltransferase [Lachnospiraceae bacterium]|nr:GT-D fold domain-containing glycosyltransferase [Lachnospiraceae bacterium]